MSIQCNQTNPTFQPLPETPFVGNVVLTFERGCGFPPKAEANLSFNGGVVPSINIPVTGGTTTGTPLLNDGSTLNIVGTTNRITTVATISGSVATVTLNTGADVPSLANANVFAEANTFNGNVVIGNAGSDTLVVNGTTTFDLPIGLDSGTDTDTGSGITISEPAGIATTDTLTTLAGATESIVITNTLVAVGDIVVASLQSYAGAGIPVIQTVTAGAGIITIVLRNIDTTDALDAPVSISFVVFEAK